MIAALVLEFRLYKTNLAEDDGINDGLETSGFDIASEAEILKVLGVRVENAIEEGLPVNKSSTLKQLMQEQVSVSG